MAAKGYGIVIAYHSDSASADAVCRIIAASGGAAYAVRCDVGVEEDVVNLFRVADSAFGGGVPLSALVNNAGILGPRTGDLSACTKRGAVDLLDVVRTNVAGPLLAIREAEKRMSTARGGAGGTIVQISSGSAYIGSPLLYGASKGALNSLTIGLVAPLAKQGIRINTVRRFSRPAERELHSFWRALRSSVVAFSAERACILRFAPFPPSLLSTLGLTAIPFPHAAGTPRAGLPRHDRHRHGCRNGQDV
jgi:NAD(P)-dependent dehydrogenase (short-subunit alcohol dehydrogenase family)